MKPIAQWKPLWPLVLAFASAFGYFVAATRFALWQPIPWLPFAGLACAVVWAVAMVRQRASVWRFAALALVAGLAGLFGWWALDFSAYESTRAAVADGQRVEQLASLSFPDAQSQLRPLLEPGKITLLVMYRGFW